MKESISTIVYNALASKIQELGYELYEVEYVKKQNGMNLTLFITNGSEPITLQDCEKVHRFVDPLLDALNPTADASYYLNVSSVGLDKPIKSDKDFNRAIGKEVEIKLFAPVDGKKSFRGIITSFDEDCVVLSCEQKQITLSRKNIGSCKFYIEF